MQNMRIGVVVSMVPVGVKWRRLARCPSWNTQTMAPKVAVRLSRLSTNALTGTSRLPVIRNSTVKVTRAMMPPARGSLANSDALESTNCADWPPTRMGNDAAFADGPVATCVAGGVRWRMAFTSDSPCSDSGSTVGMADSQTPGAPPGAVKRAEAALG